MGTNPPPPPTIKKHCGNGSNIFIRDHHALRSSMMDGHALLLNSLRYFAKAIQGVSGSSVIYFAMFGYNLKNPLNGKIICLSQKLEILTEMVLNKKLQTKLTKQIIVFPHIFSKKAIIIYLIL